jgi:uncharacterized protein YcfL
MKQVFFIVCVFLLAGCSTNTVITYRTLAVTENPVGAKVGQVDQTEGGILEAAKNGNITLISTVSKQNTDVYVTYYWPVLLGGNVTTVNTLHKEEIIVTGD